MTYSGEADRLGVKEDQFEFADGRRVDYATLQYLLHVGEQIVDDPETNDRKRQAVGRVVMHIEFEIAMREQEEIDANHLDEIQTQEHPQLTIRSNLDA